MSIGYHLRRISIAIRLALLMAILLLIAMSSFAVVMLIGQRNQALVAARWDAQRLIESLESTLRVQMLRGDAHLGEAITRIARPGGVESAILSNHRGTIRYATRGDLVGTIIGKRDDRCSACHPNGAKASAEILPRESTVYLQRKRMIASAVIPVLNSPSCYNDACHHHSSSESVLGVLQIEVPYRQVARAAKRYRNQMILLILGLVVLTIMVVLFLVRRWVGRPANELLRGTQLVAQGDMSQIIAVGQGELGELGQAFNTMQQKLKSSQRQIVMSEKLASVGKLAASVAHEINNPLTGVLAFAEDLCDATDMDDPRRADYDVIRNEAMRCREIVRNLLDFARQEQPSLTQLRLGIVLERTLKLVAKLAAFHDITVQTEVAPDLPSIQGDATQLQQVFLNLLINASEAMIDGGTLAVRGWFDPEERMVRMSFSDTGHGIDRENLRRIFDPFFSTKGGKTNGLGLAVSWSIIDQHGGKLQVESEPGNGATFHVHLPPCSPQDA